MRFWCFYWKKGAKAADELYQRSDKQAARLSLRARIKRRTSAQGEEQLHEQTLTVQVKLQHFNVWCIFNWFRNQFNILFSQLKHIQVTLQIIFIVYLMQQSRFMTNLLCSSSIMAHLLILDKGQPLSLAPSCGHWNDFISSKNDKAKAGKQAKTVKTMDESRRNVTYRKCLTRNEAKFIRQLQNQNAIRINLIFENCIIY